jgi:hypothetical protein
MIHSSASTAGFNNNRNMAFQRQKFKKLFHKKKYFYLNLLKLKKEY